MLRFRHLSGNGLIVLVLLACSGCTTDVSIPAWQKSVEDYLWNHASGDPNALRDMTSESMQRGFSVISEASPSSAIDANGVLIAHQPVGGRPAFIFLLGLVRQKHVDDIRIALMAAQQGDIQWRMGNPDESALKAYKDYRLALWKQRFPDQRDAPAVYTGFPAEEDSFELEIRADAVVVRHPASGASWKLDLAVATAQAVK